MPTTNVDKPQGPTLEDAAARMEGLLDLMDKSSGTPAPSKSAADAARAEDDEGVDEAEAETQETPAEEEAGSDEVEASGTEEADAADDRDRTVTVTIDGKTETIPLDEVAKGYQRHTDYTRKTQELATERQKVVAQTQAVQEERQTYTTMLKALQDQLQAMQPQEPDWNEVYQADPIGYARKRDEWRDRQEKLAAASFEIQRVGELQQRHQAESLKKVVADGRTKMLDMMPTWRDPKAWEADRTAIVRYAQDVAGYTQEEIAQAYDPRAIVTLHKARLYDELMARKPKPVASKGPRVVSGGTSSEGNTATRLNAAQKRLAQTGRVEDAAKIFEQLI